MEAEVENMAYTKLYTIALSADKHIEFVHEIIHIQVPPEETAPFRQPHQQDYCELIFFCAGVREIKVGENVYSFQAGDILSVRPGEAHCSRNLPCMLDRYYLHIPPDTFSFLQDGDALMRVFFGRGACEGNHIRLSEDAQRTAHDLLVRIDHTVRFSASATRDAESLACVIELLSLLSDHMQKGLHLAPTRSELLLQILSFMENAFAQEHILQDITAHFGVSRSSLWRLFKGELHMTPHQYLQNVRLENARLLLASGSDVLTAAMRCGFADSSHLIRHFKARYGTTPLKYQRLHARP